jgi:hypothetical protein
VRLHPHGIDAGVRPAPARHLLQRLERIYFLMVRDLGASGLRHAEALWHTVDSDHAPGAQYEGAADRESVAAGLTGSAAYNRRRMPVNAWYGCRRWSPHAMGSSIRS